MQTTIGKAFKITLTAFEILHCACSIAAELETKIVFTSAVFSENMKHHKFVRRRHFLVKDAWSGSMNMQVRYYILKNHVHSQHVLGLFTFSP